jgi:hypothetical protein
MGALQVESPKCGVCVNFHYEEAFIEAEGSLYRLNQVSLEEMDGRAAIHVRWPATPLGFHQLPALDTPC